MKNVLCLVLSFSISLLAIPNGFAEKKTEKESEKGKAVERGVSTSDEALMLAIENRVLRSAEVKSDDIKANVEDGIVTLSGKVDSLAASRRAVELAEHVAGVKSIVNQIVVEAGDMKDKQITNTALRQFTTDDAFDASEIKVEVEGGEATLNGQVDSLAEKRLVENKIASLKGVRSIENNLELSQRKKRSDAELQEIIDGLLGNSAALDISEITAKVKDSTVTLNGAVNSLAHKRIAVDLVSIEGITEVNHNGLKVEWAESDGMERKKRYEELSDDSIKSAINMSMENNPLLVAVADQIDVSVKNAEVTLSGKVSRVAAKETASEAAKNTIGVQGVTNDIKVEWSENPPTDEEITKNTRKAIAEDAYLGYGEIIVRTRDAHVHLYGAVDSEFEKRRAGYIAGMQPGVVHVANTIAVTNEWKPKSDKEIQEAIMSDLKLMESDPMVQVRLNVKDGVPVFTGHVGTWFQWQSLLRLAADAGARRPHIDVNVHYRPSGASDSLYVPE